MGTTNRYCPPLLYIFVDFRFFRERHESPASTRRGTSKTRPLPDPETGTVPGGQAASGSLSPKTVHGPDPRSGAGRLHARQGPPPPPPPRRQQGQRRRRQQEEGRLQNDRHPNAGDEERIRHKHDDTRVQETPVLRPHRRFGQRSIPRASSPADPQRLDNAAVRGRRAINNIFNLGY